jgi:predicted PurR-regulated permease PerM
MVFDMDIVNTVFVVSLVLLTISLIVFLAFFIPVLIQITKTLEAIQTIASLLKQYSLSINDKLTDASESFSKLKDVALNLSSSLLDMVLNLIKKKS